MKQMKNASKDTDDLDNEDDMDDVYSDFNGTQSPFSDIIHAQLFYRVNTKSSPPPATFADIAAVRVCKCASSDLISHHQQTGSSESPTHYLAVNTTLGTLSNVVGALSWLK